MELDITPVIDKNVKDVRTGEMVPLKSLWKDQTSLIVFFRRWGCVFCRVWAKQLSDLDASLKENNIRLIGIGVDEIGLQDFIDGKHFPGDLYLDSEKTIYSGLKLKRFGWLSILASLLTGESRAAISKGRSENLGGDLKGDGLQNGGALVVNKEGKVLFSFRQERPAEHIPNEKFAEVLGIKYVRQIKSEENQESCNTEQCTR